MKKNWIHFLITQKFRFDIAISFIVFINFILLSITAAGQVQLLLNRLAIDFDVYSIIIYIIVISFGMTWLFGYLLDRRIRYWQNLQTVQNSRNPQISEILANTRELNRKLDEFHRKSGGVADED